MGSKIQYTNEDQAFYEIKRITNLYAKSTSHCVVRTMICSALYRHWEW